jgi:tRNA uridine 5-carbamoylmethylation protein Kti12
LQDKLGSTASEALAEMLEEERRDVLARVDERVEARYADIRRRVHEDIAGVEIRLTNSMAQLRTEMIEKIESIASKSGITFSRQGRHADNSW